MNRIGYYLLLLLAPAFGKAQSLQQISLPQAYELAEKNYPLLKQKDLLKQTAAMDIDNLQKGFLPQVNISGQATYQSDVTKIPISLPGLAIEPPSKDQYKLIADISQLLYDGGFTKEQKTLAQLNEAVEEQQVEVSLYQVKERINQLYLGILYLDEQSREVELTEDNIRAGIATVTAQVQNGVSLKSNLDMLRAELLGAGQRAIEIKAARKGYINVLALFLGQSLPETIQLEKPFVQAIITSEITRPELQLYSRQTKMADQQNKLIRARNLPHASLFAQGGYGRPGLNFLDNSFAFYYIGGLRFNWSLGNLYTKKKDLRIVELNKKSIAVQQETFLLNTNTQLQQQQSEMDKLQQLVASDNAIIDLRASVTKAARAQLENAVITTNDFLKAINAEDQSRQALITHQVQLLQAQINYQTISGKQ